MQKPFSPQASKTSARHLSLSNGVRNKQIPYKDIILPSLILNISLILSAGLQISHSYQKKASAWLLDW